MVKIYCMTINKKTLLYWPLFRTEEFLLMSLCHGLSYRYTLASTFASNLFFSKILHLQTLFFFCTNVAWVSAYKFCAQQLYQLHIGHTASQKAFPLKILFFRTESGVEKLNTVLESLKGPLFHLWTHLLAAYTFAEAALRLLSFEKLKFFFKKKKYGFIMSRVTFLLILRPVSVTNTCFHNSALTIKLWTQISIHIQLYNALRMISIYSLNSSTQKLLLLESQLFADL
jgi:hypothetical protein